MIVEIKMTTENTVVACLWTIRNNNELQLVLSIVVIWNNGQRGKLNSLLAAVKRSEAAMFS
uniref:Uncharacterized protein n=1 Tax=Arundo donax TaxID=35708 RepID=A0A0A8Y583_ARUDO